MAMTTGPTLGNKLKLLEEKWIENDFVIDKELLDKSSQIKIKYI